MDLVHEGEDEHMMEDTVPLFVNEPREVRSAPVSRAGVIVLAAFGIGSVCIGAWHQSFGGAAAKIAATIQLSSQIKKSSNCRADAKLPKTVPEHARVIKYDLREVCPYMKFGLLHNSTCDTCHDRAKEGRPKGNFIICGGCSKPSSITCEELKKFVQAHEVEMDHTGSAPSPANKVPFSKPATKPASKPAPAHDGENGKGHDKFHAKCTIPPAEHSHKTAVIVNYPCTDCFAGDVAERIPVLEKKCCNSCIKYMNGALKTQVADLGWKAKVKVFGICKGCDANANLGFSPEKYHSHQAATITGKMDQYLDKVCSDLGIPHSDHREE